MGRRVFAAVDLGASGGRVMAGVVDGATVTLDAVHRFPNAVVERDGHLRWPLDELFDHVLDGLRLLAAELPDVESIGIDTWGVDYGLLNGDGALLDLPISYRDDRTSAAVERVHGRVDPAQLYAVNGLQFLPFNTVYQLAADQDDGRLDGAVHVVLLPDLLGFWLTGELRTEVTNASTTGLLDARSRTWAEPLLRRVGLPADRLPPIQQPGEVRGPLTPEMCARLGMAPGTVVTTVGSHDTASAVAAVPAPTGRFAYIASGTWSLVGLELDGPIISEAGRHANFTNEGGVDGRTRFLRNTGGLWLLQESMRTWSETGRAHDLAELLAGAARLPAGGPLVDVGDVSFVPPGDMPARIAAAVAAAGGAPPSTADGTTRCIMDSLADAYAHTIRRAGELAGVDVDVVHVIGGGSQNNLLCQLTADRTDRPVAAGPVEATALGNVLVQARARGAVTGSLEDIRARLAGDVALTHYRPRPTPEVP